MSDEFEEMTLPPQDHEFELSDGVWEGFRNHPLLKQELEEKMNQEAQRRAEAFLESEHAEMLKSVRSQAELKGREEGIQQGLVEAKKKIRELEDLVSQATETVRAEMKDWANAMETEWGRALLNIVSQLAVPNGEARGSELVEWVRRHLDDSFDDQKIQIFLSPAEWKLVEQAGIPKQAASWEWQSDPNLQAGQVRCESRLGRLFLDPNVSLDRLERVLQSK